MTTSPEQSNRGECAEHTPEIIVHNYGRMWPRTDAESVPSVDRWHPEQCIHWGRHDVLRAVVDGETDILVVYDTKFRAQIWRLSREKADEMWPDLIAHARANPPED